MWGQLHLASMHLKKLFAPLLVAATLTSAVGSGQVQESRGAVIQNSNPVVDQTKLTKAIGLVPDSFKISYKQIKGTISDGDIKLWYREQLTRKYLKAIQEASRIQVDGGVKDIFAAMNTETLEAIKSSIILHLSFTSRQVRMWKNLQKNRSKGSIENGVQMVDNVEPLIMQEDVLRRLLGAANSAKLGKLYRKGFRIGSR